MSNSSPGISCWLVSVGWIWLQQSGGIGKQLSDMQSGLIVTVKEGELTDHASALESSSSSYLGLKWRRFSRLGHGLMRMGGLRIRIAERFERVYCKDFLGCMRGYSQIPKTCLFLMSVRRSDSDVTLSSKAVSEPRLARKPRCRGTLVCCQCQGPCGPPGRGPADRDA